MMQRDYLCEYCERVCKNAMSLSQHRLRCEKNPGNIKDNFYLPSRKGKYVGETPSELTLKRRAARARKVLFEENGSLSCLYCEKLTEDYSCLTVHESMCPKNPSRGDRSPSEETKKKLSLVIKGRKMSDEFRLKVSEAMKRAILEHPESYTSSNRGRVKQIIVDGVKLHGSWEATFYSWAKENNLNPERCLTGFDYFWNGKNRKYFPDFYLPNLDLYVEVKGYETEQDREKWRQFPKKIIVLKKEEIRSILKDTYSLPAEFGGPTRT